jgi:long-subunit acyl-CoA synthetase (AMP-forming)
MGIFSENCPEFYITELACISDSVTIVPISADAQFLEAERVTSIIEATGLSTICVSSKTGGFLLDLKTNGKISTLKNIIVFDESNE